MLNKIPPILEVFWMLFRSLRLRTQHQSLERWPGLFYENFEIMQEKAWKYFLFNGNYCQ